MLADYSHNLHSMDSKPGWDTDIWINAKRHCYLDILASSHKIKIGNTELIIKDNIHVRNTNGKNGKFQLGNIKPYL